MERLFIRIRKFLLVTFIFACSYVHASSQKVNFEIINGDAITQEMCHEIVQGIEKLKEAGLSDKHIITALTSSEKACNWGYIYKKNKTTIARIGIVCGIIGVSLMAGIIGMIIYYSPTYEEEMAQRRWEDERRVRMLARN